MSKNIVIVESPAKAKTIEKFLGEGFTVTSSFGHIRDLPKSGMGIDLDGDFTPDYEISPDKKKVVAQLKKLIKDAQTIWLASDEDREGEAIAWHLYEALNLKNKETKRIVFHEITKPAIQNAIKNPRSVDKNLVDAQQARRVLDRIVGYELSPVLWRKIRAGLSAGRVQSVALRLISEREREINAFEANSQFRITANFTNTKEQNIPSELLKKIEGINDAQAFLEKAKQATFTVESIDKKPAKRSSAPPFTTSTLQQEASRKLGFSVKKTMMLAQRLYESGQITYMRTDSVNLSELAISSAEQVITQKYGKEFSHPTRYKTKNAGAQEAHEAIRPTNFQTFTAGTEADMKRLYELIWKRAIASQMSPASFERTQVAISSDKHDQNLTAKGEVLLFEGFLKVYLEGRDDEDEETSGILPALSEGETLSLKDMTAREGFTRPPARYTEASLVKKLEEEGIGRPSTYAATISTIQDRGYVERGEKEGVERDYRVLTLQNGSIENETKTEMTGSDKGKLIPTAIGNVVSDFLVKHFEKIVDYHFTADVEKEFDEVAEGKKKWNSMISHFYEEFHKTVEDKMESVDRSEAIQERVLGDDPKTGKPVSVRVGRYGAYAQIGTKDDEEKPTFASLKPGQNMDTITLVEALELFNLPRLVGKTPEGEEMWANFGRFGPYIKFGSLFVSIKDHDPLDIDEATAQEFVAAKKQAEKEKYIKSFEGSDVQILKGRWGPYVTDGNKNARIPKELRDEAEKLTLEQCEEYLSKAPDKKKRGATKKKATTKKKTTTAKKKAPAKKTATK